ncbi:Uncharacterised protein [Streptococcus pneumoniae]|nr:Uncharacterised protein [Streptococcus pneumoniae]
MRRMDSSLKIILSNSVAKASKASFTLLIDTSGSDLAVVRAV